MFSKEEVDSLAAEEKKHEATFAFLEAKLEKYHGLPLDEKLAAEQLAKLKEELKIIENKIKNKLDDC